MRKITIVVVLLLLKKLIELSGSYRILVICKLFADSLDRGRLHGVLFFACVLFNEGYLLGF